MPRVVGDTRGYRHQMVEGDPVPVGEVGEVLRYRVVDQKQPAFLQLHDRDDREGPCHGPEVVDGLGCIGNTLLVVGHAVALAEQHVVSLGHQDRAAEVPSIHVGADVLVDLRGSVCGDDDRLWPRRFGRCRRCGRPGRRHYRRRLGAYGLRRGRWGRRGSGRLRRRRGRGGAVRPATTAGNHGGDRSQDDCNEGSASKGGCHVFFYEWTRRARP